MAEKVLPIRAFLAHVRHYDPVWYKKKGREQIFDLEVTCDIVDAMAETHMNMLVIDVADGVKYRSHPEMERRYSVPMSDLKALVQRARRKGIETVPKLNFAQSGRHHHNEWFRRHRRLLDSEEYWRVGFDLIDELIGACQPEHFCDCLDMCGGLRTGPPYGLPMRYGRARTRT